MRQNCAGEIQLSVREAQVADLVAQGYGRKQIAESLNISENTIGMHLSRLYAALGTHGRTDLTIWVYQNPGALRRQWVSRQWQRKSPPPHMPSELVAA